MNFMLDQKVLEYCELDSIQQLEKVVESVGIF
jgi:hypothetical protein